MFVISQENLGGSMMSSLRILPPTPRHVCNRVDASSSNPTSRSFISSVKDSLPQIRVCSRSVSYVPKHDSISALHYTVPVTNLDLGMFVTVRPSFLQQKKLSHHTKFIFCSQKVSRKKNNRLPPEEDITYEDGRAISQRQYKKRIVTLFLA